MIQSVRHSYSCWMDGTNNGGMFSGPYTVSSIPGAGLAVVGAVRGRRWAATGVRGVWGNVVAWRVIVLGEGRAGGHGLALLEGIEWQQCHCLLTVLSKTQRVSFQGNYSVSVCSVTGSRVRLYFERTIRGVYNVTALTTRCNHCLLSGYTDSTHTVYECWPLSKVYSQVWAELLISSSYNTKCITTSSILIWLSSLCD